ncbi:AraC family transcriptional regulator [Caballeronia concitans]|uniref:AraC family transcriptional regulator n=2 Tax=Caballeronia concitans TaxID=1777133 RepID=A0A658QX02_9BURK|nr:transcriptional regulator, AraC family [Burkholderia sp. MR1]SAL30270.1 AraC family transcriptional regulator [Caballeronia concitans]
MRLCGRQCFSFLHCFPMRHPSATVPISVVNGFLSGADRAAVVRLAALSGISHELLSKPAARVTQEQFSTLYRLLAKELDDEMPGIFARPLRNGTLKFLCLSLLDAPRLEVALHRFGQFFHLVLDEFQLVSRREGPYAYVEFVPNPHGPQASPLAREMMLKLVHGVASWLIREKIPLVEAAFQFLRPAQTGDLLYLFPGPVRFGRDRTFISFDAAYLDRRIRQRKSDLDAFLQRAPEDWIFVSLTEEMVCHRVRQCIAGGLPITPTVDAVAQELNYSVRTLCRRLEAEGTTFQAIKDEVRRDIAIQRLTRSDDAIGAIAYDVGFDNPTAFHRAFRHWTGSTPTAYRHRNDG